MLVLGFGLGMTMQVLVLAAQNAVDYEYLGVATSGSTLFRQVGGSIGVAAFGAVFANHFAANLAKSFPAGAGITLPAAPNPAAIAHLPPPVHDAYVNALTDALQPVFLIAAAVAVVAFALTWLLRELPLKTTARAPDVGDGFHASHDDNRLREIERALSLLARKDQRWEMYERGAEQAELELRPPALWLLARLGEREPLSEAELVEQVPAADVGLDEHLDELRRQGFVEPGETLALSESGRAGYERLVAVRRAGLRTLLDGWNPDEHPELRRLIDELARDLVAQMPSPVPA
jgi:DNA-binding MarR family transcriptional regulator